MDEVDFAHLIEAARQGDGTAIATLLKRFEPEIRTMVRVRLPRTLRSMIDSMDIVQAVWTSVFTGKNDDLARFSDPARFRGYLAGVAKNKVLEEYRRRTRTKKYDLSREESLYVRKGERDVPRDVAAPDPSASENIQAVDRFGQLIEGRTEEETRVLELRSQGMTYDEVARRLGIHERSVRRIIESVRDRMEARQWR